MPNDHAFDDDDTPLTGEDAGRARRFNEFDCPDCSANNPYDDGFGDGDEVRCYYCGLEYHVEVKESGRLKLKAV